MSAPNHHYARALLLLAMLISMIACSANGETWQRIQQTGVLRVGLDPTYPPFENADGGELRGIDVDLARELASNLGLQAEFVHFGYDGLYDALATGQVDVLISALVIRPDQLRDFAYSEPYFNAGQYLVVPSGSAIGGMQDLAGHSLAVELGAQGHVTATEWQRRIPDLAVQPNDTPALALDAVSNGEADAALVDAISARLYLATNPLLSLVQPSVTVEPFAIVVRIEDERLLRELDAALQAIEADGTLDTIISRHMQSEQSP